MSPEGFVLNRYGRRPSSTLESSFYSLVVWCYGKSVNDLSISGGGSFFNSTLPFFQVHRYTGTQVHRYTGTQVHRYTGTQVHRYTGTQVHRYTGTQVHRYTGTQVHRYTGTQVHHITFYLVHPSCEAAK